MLKIQLNTLGFGLGSKLIVGSKRSYFINALLIQLDTLLQLDIPKQIILDLKRISGHAYTWRVSFGISSRQSLIKLLAYKRHERCNQSQRGVEAGVQTFARIIKQHLLLIGLVNGVEARLQVFNVVIAQIVEPKVEQTGGGRGQIECLQALITQADRLTESGKHPFVHAPQHAHVGLQVIE